MRLPEPTFSEYELETVIKENWSEIIELIEPSLEEWGKYGERFIQELRKYDLNYMTLRLKKEFKENDEQQE